MTVPKQPSGSERTHFMVKVSLLSVIAFVIMLMEFPIPMFPSFLMLDLSDLPALVAGFALGPVAGISVELIKNLLHLVKTTSGGIGELANFLVGVALVAPAAWIYALKKDKRHALLGLVVGILCMGIMGALANYFILLPFYSKMFPMEVIVGMAAKVNPAVNSLWTLILYTVLPFNLVKGAVISVVTLLLYKHISPLLHKN